MVGNGRGSSKKLAKGRAARALLDKLDDRVPHWEGNNVKPPITRACFANYVCVLHNFCIQIGAQPMPRYSTSIGRSSKDWNYTTVCRCGSFKAVGMGHNQKSAKKDAALGVINQIKATYNVNIP